MVNTFAYLVLGVPLTMVLALAAAVGLNRIKILRGLFRVGYYLPVVTSIVAVSVVWRFLLRDEGGLVNAVLAPGRHRRPGLAGQHEAGPAVAGGDVGLAQPRRPDGDLPGRAADDPDGGAGGVGGRRCRRWQRFRYITLPMLRPTLLFGAVITSIGYLQFFEEAFVMTKGGPLDATRSVTFYTYDQFGFGNYGLRLRGELRAVPRGRRVHA